MLDSCRKLPEEDLPKPSRKSAHTARSWEEAWINLAMSLDIAHPGDAKSFAVPQTAPEIITTRETQIVPPVPWDLLDALVLSKPFTTTSPILSIPRRATNHTQQITLFWLFVLPGIPASRAMQTSRACRGTEWRKAIFSRDLIHSAGFSSNCATAAFTLPSRVPPPSRGIKSCTVHLWDHCTFRCFPLYIHLPHTDAERDRAGGSARWSAPTPVTHQFHFRDLWGHRFLSSRQHLGNVRAEWQEGKEAETPQRWSHGKSAPPVLKRDPLHSGPSRRRKPAQTVSPAPQHDFHQGATRRGSVPDAR